MKNLVITLSLTTVFVAFGQHTFGAEGEAMKATATEKMFIKKAAKGGMTEVNLGKLASEKGGSSEVKDFGNKMVTDHSKINDNLKEVAGKLGVMVPEKVDAMNEAKIAKMEKMSGASFDKAYVQGMMMAHEKDIADFEKADKEVKDANLKKFIENAIPTMKDHLEMIKKFSQANKG